FALLVNIALDSPTVRWWLELMFGLSRRRRLPRLAGRTFLNQARRRGWTRRLRIERRRSRSEEREARPERRTSNLEPRSSNLGKRVAYFVDVYANFVDPLIGMATVEVLRHNGIEVYVPPGQRGCGMSALAHGDVESAREIARHNVRVLAEAARAGYAIVCSEPT